MCPVFAISLGKPLNLSCFTCKMAEPKLCECRSEVECYSSGTHTHTTKAWKWWPSGWKDYVFWLFYSQVPNVLKGLHIHFVTWDGGKEGSFMLKGQPDGQGNVVHTVGRSVTEGVKHQHWLRGWTLKTRGHKRPSISRCPTVKCAGQSNPEREWFMVIRLGTEQGCFRREENLRNQIAMMATQSCERAKNHWTVHCKWANFMATWNTFQ